MSYFTDKTDYYYEQYLNLAKGETTLLPGKTYVLKDNSILSLPREDGDNRYQYGEGGFNLWTYASGNMHANKGLFSLFLRGGEGGEQNIGFLIGVKSAKGYRLIPLTSALGAGDSASVKRFCVFTATQAFYFTEYKGILSVLNIYADSDNNLTFTVRVKNMSGEDLEIALDSYINPYLKEGLGLTDEDKWFKKGEVINADAGNGGLPGFLFTVNVDLTRTLSVINYGAISQSLTCKGTDLKRVLTTTSRRDFVGGVQHSLNDPLPLKKGRFKEGRQVTAFTDTAVAGQMAVLDMPAQSEAVICQKFTYKCNCLTPCTYDGIAQNCSLKELDRCLEAADAKAALKGEKLRFSVSDTGSKAGDAAKLNAFLPQLVKQVDFCATISGYVQLSPYSLVGIRDVFQAIEGNLYSAPEVSRAKIIEALGFTDPSGRPPRQYALPAQEGMNPPMDLRPFIDQGVWIIDTVISYLKFTKDMSILGEVCGYYSIVDEAARLAKKSDEKDTVLDHLCRIMDYILKNQDEETGCIHALYGDWNDALDGLGVRADGKPGYGTGVSVMVSLQVVRNLKDMRDLLKKLGKKSARQDRYLEALERLEEGLKKYAIVKNDSGEERIVHGWGDNRSYYVGSFCDKDGCQRHGITSNAFWVLSGMHAADTCHKKTILKAFKELDSKYGMKTFTPGFARDSKGFGRIGKLPLGTAENGATYIHAAAFATMALFRMGESTKAWDQLHKLMPIFHKKVSTSPYVMPNSYGENRDLNVDGESMNDWQTGSSNVILKMFINDIFGFRPDYDSIVISPAGGPYSDMSMELQYCGHRLKISLASGKESGITVNGKAVKRTFRDSVTGRDALVIKDSEITGDLDIVVFS